MRITIIRKLTNFAGSATAWAMVRHHDWEREGLQQELPDTCLSDTTEERC